MVGVIKGKKTHKTGTKRMYRQMTLQIPSLMDVLTLSVVMAAALHAACCGLSSYYRRTHFLHFYHEEGGSRLPVHCATVVITTRKQMFVYQNFVKKHKEVHLLSPDVRRAKDAGL